MNRRDLLLCTGGWAATLLVPQVGLAGELVAAEATRRGDVVRLSWPKQRLPVSVYMASVADAPIAAMRCVARDRRAQELAVCARARPRPYFLLTAQNGSQARVAERLLPLEGGRNFRDLGGYRAGDGTQVRWGKLFRSGYMSDLTAADIDYLQVLGIQIICDLRSQQERTGAPSPLLASGGPRIESSDYDFAQLMRGLKPFPGSTATVADFTDYLSDAYVAQAEQGLVEHLRRIFAHLLAGEVPLAFNCTGGKDRTGVVAAMILSVLGVPRPTIVADYGLTGRYLPRSEINRMMADGGQRLGVSPELAAATARMPNNVQEVLLGTDPTVMELCLSKIEARHGNLLELARQQYGLDTAAIERLRRLYTA